MTFFYGLLDWITNWLYGVPGKVARFERDNPDETVLAQGAVKAKRSADNQPVQYEPEWILARRGALILTDQRLVCDDWSISLERVKYAEAVTFGSGMVLKVADDTGTHYQFGLNRSAEWLEQTVLPLKRTDEAVTMSLFSLVLRVAIVVVPVIWLLQRLSG